MFDYEPKTELINARDYKTPEQQKQAVDRLLHERMLEGWEYLGSLSTIDPFTTQLVFKRIKVPPQS